MTRPEQHQRNRAAADRARELCAGRFMSPSYAAVVAALNAEGHQTGWGRPWTRTALRRMLQRNGVRGLHGLFHGDKGALCDHYARECLWILLRLSPSGRHEEHIPD